jgi:hypothetical protein
METALVKHANAARDEAQHLRGEFMDLARTTPVPTPAIDRLQQYYEPDAPEVPEGSADIPLRWRSMLAAVGTLAALLAGVVLLVRWLCGRSAGEQA